MIIEIENWLQVERKLLLEGATLHFYDYGMKGKSPCGEYVSKLSSSMSRLVS